MGYAMKEFVINKHGRIVLPFNFFPEMDFSVIETLEHLQTVIARDFGEKAPSEKDIMGRRASESTNPATDSAAILH